MAAGLEDAQAFAPDVSVRYVVVPMVAHEGEAIGRVGDDCVDAGIGERAQDIAAIPAIQRGVADGFDSAHALSAFSSCL